MASGMTIYISTDRNRVSHGTVMDADAQQQATSGAKANTMMASLSATWDRVNSGSPLDRWLHTNTMAVQGAAASRIRPAM